MGTKQLERVWVAGTVLVAVLLVAIGYFALISPERGKTHDLQSQVADATLQNTQLRNEVARLASDNENLSKYRSDLATAQQALPSTSGIPDFLNTLQQIDATTGVSTSVTVGPPTDVTGLSGTSSATSGTGGTGTPTLGSAHIYALPLTAQVSGSVDDLNAFLNQLQSVQPRAVLVSQITETSGAGSGGSTRGSTNLQLTMQAFVAPTNPLEDAQLAAASTN